MKSKMKKTAEEILTKNIKTEDAYWLTEGYLKSWYPKISEGIISAMQEYKDQHTAPLIEALETAKNQIEYLHQKFSKIGSGEQALIIIETALLNAKGL